MRRPFFAVLGGMGTLATEGFVRLLDARTKARSDQDYLDYVVFNDAGVPDRTDFITGASNDDPAPVIADDIAKATAIGARFLVLTCNTAHYFWETFQSLTPVPLLHMPRLAVARLADMYPSRTHPRVGFLGTVGSCTSGVYRVEAEAAGYGFVEPGESLQARVTSLIYDDVKGGGQPDRERYASVLQDMLDPDGAYACDALILGCTELSVLHEMFPTPSLPVIDAQSVLADTVLSRARSLMSSPG